MDSKQKKAMHYATGRRKRSIARLYLKPGKGDFIVNGKTIEEYFGANTLWTVKAQEAMKVLLQQGLFDITSMVVGGGISGQAGALSLALARALDAHGQDNSSQAKLESQDSAEEEGTEGVDSWHKVLRKGGYLTRDSRVVLRKKVGLVKARKAKQFSKR